MSTAASSAALPTDIPASRPPSIAYPIVRYRDTRRALAWLEQAFGLREILIVASPDGSGDVMHAELHLTGAVFMFGSLRAQSVAGSYELYVAIDADALDAHYAQALAAGAEVTRDLAPTGYDSREYTARDIEGNEWSFGTYRPTATLG